ncbi:MAG: NAD(P)H-hydrate epimerase, partial [Lutibacter sp.]
MEILSPQQLALADKDTIKSDKITSLELMERAAIGCFNWIKSRIKPEDVTIHIFCGIGNNGGDGLVIARHLQINNYKVNPYVVNFSHKRTNEFLENYEKLKELGDWPEVINSEKEFPKITENDLVIDAIFGIGLTRPATGFTKKLIEYLNRSKAFILSIDVPSGLFCNQPITDFNAIIKSNHLLTFQHPKLSFFLSNSKDFVSTWEVIDIGLNRNFIKNLDAKNHYVDKNFALNLYQYRTKWQHKGNFGHTLIIGGSYGKIGAVILSTKSALKIGSGLVSAYLPKCGYEVLQNAIPEAMVEVDEEKQLSFFNFKTKPNAIGIGPGMGTSEKTLLGFEGFLKTNKIPLVIDADALNLLSENKHLLKCIPKNSVLTPHPKELERLIGKWKNDFEK